MAGGIEQIVPSLLADIAESEGCEWDGQGEQVYKIRHAGRTYVVSLAVFDPARHIDGHGALVAHREA